MASRWILRRDGMPIWVRLVVSRHLLVGDNFIFLVFVQFWRALLVFNTVGLQGTSATTVCSPPMAGSLWRLLSVVIAPSSTCPVFCSILPSACTCSGCPVVSHGFDFAFSPSFIMGFAILLEPSTTAIWTQRVVGLQGSGSLRPGQPRTAEARSAFRLSVTGWVFLDHGSIVRCADVAHVPVRMCTGMWRGHG